MNGIMVIIVSYKRIIIFASDHLSRALIGFGYLILIVLTIVQNETKLLFCSNLKGDQQHQNAIDIVHVTLL
jgi:hypothetical protein